MLNKSQYLIGRHCTKRLWLKKYRADEAASGSKGDAQRGLTGELIGFAARRLFPTGVAVSSEAFDKAAQVAETQRLLDEGAEVLFEAAFLADGTFARCDVLVRRGDAFRIVEVKSSTRVKEEHLEDLAFQVMVLRRMGLDIVGVDLCRVDSSKERGEEPLLPDEFLVIEDVTEQVEQRLAQVADWSAALIRVLESPLEPEVPTNTHCLSPTKCEFYDFCHRDLPQHDLVSLPGIRSDTVIAFRESGYQTIESIPEGVRLTPSQQKVWDVLRFNRPFVAEGLPAALAKIKFPAHFIDFEATSPALPLFPGMRPYQPFPFQWSDHVLQSSDAGPEHFGFLHLDDTDPRTAFSVSLFERVRDAATIVFYSSYELTTVRALSQAGIVFGSDLVHLLETRGFDLLKVVKDNVYLAEFDGSYSIKRVLPALVPDLAYEGLRIKDGDTAAAEYLRMHAPGTTDTDRLEIAIALEDYCAVDTLAMVRLYQALMKLGP